jgi:hypothetical protein
MIVTLAMFTKSFFILTAFLANSTDAGMLRTLRQLSLELIAGFEPSSIVTDHVRSFFLDSTTCSTAIPAVVEEHETITIIRVHSRTLALCS